MKNIVLASASPRRAELLKLINLEFIVVPSYITETIDEKLSIEEVVQSLACQKATDVAKNLKAGELVIGADTVVVKNGILGKPQNREQAFCMLQALQGEWHEVLTGLAVIDTRLQKIQLGFERTRVKMKPLSDEKIISYINTGESDDKAGAYGIQGFGSLLIERIDGCYFNVVGLPLQKLSCMMEDFGVKFL